MKVTDSLVGTHDNLQGSHFASGRFSHGRAGLRWGGIAKHFDQRVDRPNLKPSRSTSADIGWLREDKGSEDREQTRD